MVSSHRKATQSSQSVSQDDAAATLDMVIALIATGRFDNDHIYSSLDATDGEAVEAVLQELEAVDSEKFDRARHAPLTKAAFTSQQSSRKGKLFEAVSNLVMAGIRCFKVDRDITTNVNQIDLLVRLEPLSRMVPAFDSWGAHFICECKFHEKRFDGDWIDQLIAILTVQRASAGILITKHPALFRGRGGSIATKIQLYAVQNRVILLFSKDELRQHTKNRTLLKEIVRKHVNALAGIPELLRE